MKSFPRFLKFFLVVAALLFVAFIGLAINEHQKQKISSWMLFVYTVKIPTLNELTQKNPAGIFEATNLAIPPATGNYPDRDACDEAGKKLISENNASSYRCASNCSLQSNQTYTCAMVCDNQSCFSATQ